MTALTTWFRNANRPTRRAAVLATALAVMLVAALLFALDRVLPASVEVIAVPGRAVAAHPDGRRIVVAHEHALSIVDTGTGAVTATVALGSLTLGRAVSMVPGTSRAVAVAVEGPLLVTVDTDTATVVSVTEISEAPGTNQAALDDPLNATAVAVDPSGGAYVGDDFAVSVDGKVWRSDPGGQGIGGVSGSGGSFYEKLSLSPDGRLLYAASRSRVLVVDTASGRIERDEDVPYQAGDPPHTATAAAIRLAADGEHVFTVQGRERRVVARTLAGDPVEVIETASPVNGIALSPDGATLYVALDDQLLAVDIGGYT